MENNPILQPLLLDYNEDQTLNFQQHAVTTGTSIQPLYGSQQSGNALIGNSIFESISQGNSQFSNSNNMVDIQVGISSGHHHLQQQQFAPNTQTRSIFNGFFCQESSDTSKVFEVEEINFEDYFFKIQRREKGTSIQRIKNGNITMLLKFKNKESRNQVTDVVIKVKRTNESRLKPEERAGEVMIPFQDNKRPELIQDKQILVQIDLDSAHTITPNGLLLYRLNRNQTELNVYHLVIEVHYSNNSIAKRNTRTFKLIGKENKQKASPAKRKFDDEANMEGHSRKIPWMDHSYSSGNGGSPYSTSSPSLSGQNIDRIIRAKEVVAEHIQAKTLDIDGMHVGCMVTKQCDVAYHFPLKDNSEVFQEGEIVGFVNDPKNDNKQVVCKLDYKLASESILKGVITRSQYLEARLPENGGRSETICMLGMVPVQVIGSVHMNEPLYASPDRPGLAIGGHQLDVASLKEASFIGYSFSARKTEDDTSVGVVEAAVGILQSASQCLVSEKFRDIEEDFGEKFGEIKKESRKRRRCLMITTILTTIFLLLLGILLWQFFMPGSALRYYFCRKGRMNPHGSANFWYISERDKDVRAHVNGIEFSFNGLIKKMGYTYLNRNLNGTGYRYYLNIDRCAYGQLRDTKDRATGQKEVHGPKIFAVDRKCWHAYFYTDVTIKEEWKPYPGVYWPKYRNIFCHPEPPNRREERIESEDCL